jgi:hypothetical protein
MLDMIVADATSTTVYPCSCVRDMNPVERRLWPLYLAHKRNVLTTESDTSGT